MNGIDIIDFFKIIALGLILSYNNLINQAKINYYKCNSY